MESSVDNRTEQPSVSPFMARYDWAANFIFTAIAVIAVFCFGLRTNVVSGPSMNPTLSSGDVLLTSRIGMGPNRGDIIVLTKPNRGERVLIKRVIATEGQTVDIDFALGVVYVDGQALDETFTNSPTNLAFDMTFPATVPEGCVFAMGDNRNNSRDSRDSSVGMVDTRYIQGRVLVRVAPLDRFGSV